jgi:uncharacterized DUF497 family protein
MSMAAIFVWDPVKAANNQTKHSVTFEEAQTVFDNPLAVIFADEAHSTDEVREMIVGHSTAGKLLIVIFTEREEGTIRLISARSATKQERQDYEEHTP